MQDFDLDLFWSLPRTEGALVNDGAYCAMGAAGKAMGLSDAILDSEDIVHPSFLEEIDKAVLQDIYLINDKGCTAEKYEQIRKAIRQDATDSSGRVDFVLENKLFTENCKPNHEKAKRMLLEALKGKVNFISKDIKFTEVKTVEV